MRVGLGLFRLRSTGTELYGKENRGIVRYEVVIKYSRTEVQGLNQGVERE